MSLRKYSRLVAAFYALAMVFFVLALCVAGRHGAKAMAQDTGPLQSGLAWFRVESAAGKRAVLVPVLSPGVAASYPGPAPSGLVGCRPGERKEADHFEITLDCGAAGKMIVLGVDFR